jgi:hypothetical protein
MKFRGLGSLGHRTCGINLRHSFAIGPLCDTYLFNRQARLYYCTRCSWSFLVAGSLAAVIDDEGRPVAGVEAQKRFRSFEDGPCPVLEGLTRELNSAPLGDESRQFPSDGNAVGIIPMAQSFRAWWRNSGWHRRDVRWQA